MRNLNSHVLIAVLASCVLPVRAAPPGRGSSQVVSVNPTGAVKSVQQVVVRFSNDMVSMGDPRSKTDPFKLTCNDPKKRSTAHTTHWADSRNWVLDFKHPLPSGISCQLEVAGALKDLGGERILGLNEYTFTTAGPALLAVSPVYGSIAPDQYFVALTDGPLDLKSVLALGYFEVEGFPDPVRMNIINGPERDTVVRAAVKDNWRWNSYAEVIKKQAARPLAKMKEFDHFIVLGAQRRFPENAKVILHWPRGIKSASGLPVEEAQAFEFKVIEPFTATFNCERTAAGRACNPILNMSVNFTARVSHEILKTSRLEGAKGKIWTPESRSGAQESEPIDSLTFKGPFPENSAFRLVIPGKIKDELGRPLKNQGKFPLSVRTDEYSPLLKFSAPFGILELKGDPILPVSVRNLEKNLPVQALGYEGKSLTSQTASEIINWIQLLRDKDERYDRRSLSLFSQRKVEAFKLPKPGGAREFEVMGIPLKKPGFHVIEIASPKLGNALTVGNSMYVATGALVTDLAVHFKYGRESSLVWVTHLSSSQPADGAQVSIYNSKGLELASGKTAKDGTLRFNLPLRSCDPGVEEIDCEIWAFAQKDGDLSFTSSEWSKGLETYRFNVSQEYLTQNWGPQVFTTIFDRMVAQPGETINMKHILRERRSSGFAFLNPKFLPKRALVVHNGSQKVFELPFVLDAATGSASGQFQIPKESPLGSYSVYLSNTDKPRDQSNEENAFDWSSVQTGELTVTQYRIPLMKANVKVQGATLVAPQEVEVDLSAAYLSGGPARRMKAKVRASLQDARPAFQSSEAGEYSFYDTELKAGTKSGDSSPETAEDTFLKVQSIVLNDDGGKLVTIPQLPETKKLKNLVVEMEYVDPNGETKTASARRMVYPSDFAVGLSVDNWIAKPGSVKVKGLILNTDGKFVSGVRWRLDAFKTQYISHRKRLVGGFYSYDSKREITRIAQVCQGVSDADGRFVCEPKRLPPGDFTLQATVRDPKGRPSFSNAGVNILESGVDQWWIQSDSDRIDLIPEKRRFEPGEVAKFSVRTPFETASALVTIEREGILDSFVTQIRRDKPVLEIPMKGSYAPNIFVSVVLVRGRVGEPPPTALLDLARPSLKMGLTSVHVGWRDHELKVQVTPDKNKYRVREKAEIAIRVETATGNPLPPNTEVALAVVDEGLLRLKANTSWNILDKMMGERPLAVSTASGQNQVIGRRHFGAKAKEPGGGGGAGSGETRELFDPLLYWNPRLKVDSQGRVRVGVPLNDSITSFRFAAIATGGAQHFGDGQASIETSKDLILYSGFAPLMREGDQVQNTFTIRNTTTRPMKIEFGLSSSEIPQLPKIAPVDLAASEAKTLSLPLPVPSGKKALTFRLHAKDETSKAEDTLLIKAAVEDAVPARILQATLFQLDSKKTIPVREPADALPNKGSLDVSVRPSLVSGLEGVRSYMRDYPFTCLEQKVSKAIVLGNPADIRAILNELPAYLDADGLLKFFPGMSCGSVLLTRYVLSILNTNGFEVPKTIRERLTNGLTLAVNDRIQCQPLWPAPRRSSGTNELRVLALEALSFSGTFDPAWVASIKITPNLWKTETLTAWYRLLSRETKIPQRDAEMTKALTLLRSRLNFQGSLLSLQGEKDSEVSDSFFTSPDQQALNVFGLFLENDLPDDAGRFARGLTARLRRGHWDTTMANAWGVTQFRKFSAKFEKESISGETRVTADAVRSQVDWKQKPTGDIIHLAWPEKARAQDVNVQFEQSGKGKPWVHFQTRSAIPLKAAWDLGYRISKKVTPVAQAEKGRWKAGDVANVELTIEANTDQSWVVVQDPVPAGASHLGAGLDGSSELLDRDPKSKSRVGEPDRWPSDYDEKSLSGLTSYAGFLPRGKYTLNYRIRLNSAGSFKLPPTHVEAMYSSETFGEMPNANWQVAP